MPAVGRLYKKRIRLGDGKKREVEQRFMNIDFFRKKIRKLFFSIQLQGIKNVNCSAACNNTVVLVRLDAIGDFIMSYSIFCEYRKFYQNKKIILICSASCELLARTWNIADEVIAIEMEKYSREKSYRESMNKILSDISEEMVIQLVANRTAEMEYIVGRLQSDVKIALSRDNEESILRKRWDRVYSRILPYDNKNDFEMKKYFYLLKKITNTDIVPYQSLLPKTTCTHIGKKPYFVIAQGGSFPAKKWENEKYASIGNYILEKQNMKCYLIGAKADKDDSELICGMIHDGDRVVNLTGMTTILDSIERIRGAELVLTNDTVFVHIAVAVNTKCVCIAGGWHWGRFIPYDLKPTSEIYRFPLTAYHEMDCYNCNFCSKRCRKIKDRSEKKFPCIEQVSVSTVKSLLMECLTDDK